MNFSVGTDGIEPKVRELKIAECGKSQSAGNKIGSKRKGRKERKMLDRRQFLSACAGGLAFSGGLAVSGSFPQIASAEESVSSAGGPVSAGDLVASGSPVSASAIRPGKAKHVIQIWMWGGPSHLETFDPKPGAGPAYCGTWDSPLVTNVPQMEISQSLPELARCADLYSCIRTMTHETNHHESASYRMQTGRMPGEKVFPNLGAVISKMRGYDAGYDSPIPPYVVLTTGQGRFSESGFLGARYKPFITGGDPSKTPFLVSGYVLPGIDQARQARRQELLRNLDSWGNAHSSGHELLDEVLSARQNAFQLISGTAAETFDLGKETDSVRDAYGRNWFGQSCLMARRLVERGVPYITINYRGWDTHKRHFETLTRRQPEWDVGLAMLLKDLRDRNLLDETIIWWGGEFGRTPKIQTEPPWFGGRGHFGRCFSVMLAGGGFQGGKIVGKSDETGEHVAERPVWPQDLLGSIYWQMGIDPTAKMPNEKGFDLPIMDPPSENGWLTELMDAA